MKTIVIIYILLGVSFPALKAQSAILFSQFKRIRYWAEASHAYEAQQHSSPIDSLYQANADFQALLLRYTATQPATIEAAFDSLRAYGLQIASSEDGRFRIYSWDTWTGGTMHFFENVVQYRMGDGTRSTTLKDTTVEGDPGVWFSEIHTVPAKEGTYYLAVEHGVFSSRDHYHGVRAFWLGDDVQDFTVRVFDGDGKPTNSIGIGYDFHSVRQRPERPLRLIAYDAETQVLSVPVVTEEGEVTKAVVEYRFNGKQFKYLRTLPAKP